VGLQRRRNAERDGWLPKVDESHWPACPRGGNAQEQKAQRPRPRVQEVDRGAAEPRVFVIDADERRCSEQSKRAQALARPRVQWARVQRRVAEGKWTEAAPLGAAAERALRAQHGHR
jgi:hypothetical protein